MGGGLDPSISRDVADAVRDTIYRATILLDSQEWNNWLELCDESFSYDIKSWSPEINYDMTYLHASRKDMEALIRLLPKHNTDHSPLTRHTSVYTVDVGDNGETASAVSGFIVFQHLLDGTNSHIDSGESRLFLVGKYLDTFKIVDGRAMFTSRIARLENRRLDKGSHWPI
ncbi:nuclear transport factor 2 family protein [Chelatococcus sambhunathii]|uniref:Nuclear transport factor 2 family protein n=2 Tax=Chelatococcus sambhunathii TaxID=363953 RepID=A0ABU1DBI6_9HYPH|nr:nuclear transport factor 2 family protein [Chelatococcus sambhunathii]